MRSVSGLAVRWVREVWAMLTSAWVAVAVVGAFIVVAVAGSMLPQASTMSAYALLQWQSEHSWVSWAAEPLGLFQAFSSWTFIAILAVLALNLVACTADRTVRRARARGKGGRFGAAFAGSLILHAGLLVVLTGGAATAAWRFDATAVATEGQTLDLRAGDFVRATVGPLGDVEDSPPLTMTLDRFRPDYRDGAPVAFDSDVTLAGGGGGSRELTIAVNDPIEVEGWRFTQSGHGYSPAIIVVSPSGVVLTDSFVALESQRDADGATFTDRVGVPGFEGELQLSVLPDLVYDGGRAGTASLLPRNPALEVAHVGEGGEPEPGIVIPLGQQAGVAGYNVVFTDLRYWSAFRVVRDPGRQVVNAGFVLCLAGLLVRYLPGSIRKVFSRADGGSS